MSPYRSKSKRYGSRACRKYMPRIILPFSRQVLSPTPTRLKNAKEIVSRATLANSARLQKSIWNNGYLFEAMAPTKAFVSFPRKGKSSHVGNPFHATNSRGKEEMLRTTGNRQRPRTFLSGNKRGGNAHDWRDPVSPSRLCESSDMHFKLRHMQI